MAKSTHAGIPVAALLRQRLEGRVHFWPFDGWDIPAGRSVVAEVYPALWSRGFAHGNRTPDQHDAFSIAAWLSRDRNGSLSAFLKPNLTRRSAPWRRTAQFPDTAWAPGWWGVSLLSRSENFWDGLAAPVNSPGRRPARPRSTATAADVEGFAKLFADDLKSGADDGVVSPGMRAARFARLHSEALADVVHDVLTNAAYRARPAPRNPTGRQ